MIKYKHYIFDLDFTLVDASDGIYKCTNYALNKLGKTPASKESILKTIGLSLEKSYEFLTGDMCPLNKSKFDIFFVEQAHIDLIDNTNLLAGAHDSLYRIKANGFTLSIVTNKYRHALSDIINRFELSNLIDFSISGDEMVNKKPHPESLLKALSFLNSNNSNAIYIGDSIVDASAAANANIDFIGITTGTNSKEELLEYPNIKVIDSLEELFS